MRSPGRALRLAWFVLPLAACATARPPAATGPASPLADVAFTPIDGERAGLGWSARASFHDVAGFFDSLPSRLPAGCSAHLDLAFAEERDGRVWLDVGGTIFRERHDLGPAVCADWHRIVKALDGLAAAIPKRAWLRELHQDGDRLEISGLLRGTEAEVGTFAAALSARDGFREARIVSIQPTDFKGMPMLEFRLALRLGSET
jgi:hypothetical protein